MALTAADGTWTVTTWPWPQVWFGSYYTMAVALDGTNLDLYELYCDTSDDWQASNIVSLGANANIDVVNFIDFGEFYAVSTFGLVSDVVYVDGVIRNPGTGAPLYTSLPTANIPKFGCGCNFNGQALIGCIDHDDVDTFGDCGYNSVIWSEIGTFDFKTYDNDREKRLYKTAGYRNMEWGEHQKGIVCKVLKFGDKVIVYGTQGVAQLTPVDKPVFTYGYKNLEPNGVYNGNCVDGDENFHCMVDLDGDIWLASEGSITRLGYREYMNNMTMANIKVTWIKGKKWFYISDGSYSYVLTEYGLTSVTEAVTSGGVYRGILAGFWKDLNDDELRIITSILDFKTRSMKSVEFVEVGGNYRHFTAGEGGGADVIQDWYARAEYRYSYSSDGFTEGSWVMLNPQGIGYLGVTANEFRIAVKGAKYLGADASIDSLYIKIKRDDKRFTRGMNNVSKFNA